VDTTCRRRVIVKFPLLNSQARSAICEDLELYLREMRFYQEIGLANPLRPARPYLAAFDETTHDFVLVLEDLGRLRCVADQIVGCPAADATAAPRNGRTPTSRRGDGRWRR
jgi:hypothetical protein